MEINKADLKTILDRCIDYVRQRSSKRIAKELLASRVRSYLEEAMLLADDEVVTDLTDNDKVSTLLKYEFLAEGKAGQHTLSPFVVSIISDAQLATARTRVLDALAQIAGQKNAHMCMQKELIGRLSQQLSMSTFEVLLAIQILVESGDAKFGAQHESRQALVLLRRNRKADPAHERCRGFSFPRSLMQPRLQ